MRLCLDSFAATRNLEKGGGPVQGLCEVTKRIWEECESCGLTMYPEWVPREENTYADSLSKAWENWYRLSREAYEEVQCMLGRAPNRRIRHAPIQNVSFNQIRNALQHAEEKAESVCIIHPRWEGQSWWPALIAARVYHRELGPVSAVLMPPPEDALGRKPDWSLHASVVDFQRK